MIRAVLFDLDDTLFDHAFCARAALGAVRSCYDCFTSFSASALERHHARLLEELHLRVLAGEIDLDAARVARFRLLFGTAGVVADATLAHAAAVRYREEYLRARRAVAGACAVLAALKPRARIAVVSNNLLQEQRDKLRHCGLDPYVDALIVSEEAGVSKPDPAIFRRALDAVGCAADEAVMVGDSWPADVLGAHAAGVAAIWYNPGRMPPPDPSAGVPELQAFEPVDTAVDLILRSRPESGRQR